MDCLPHLEATVEAILSTDHRYIESTLIVQDCPEPKVKTWRCDLCHDQDHRKFVSLLPHSSLASLFLSSPPMLLILGSLLPLRPLLHWERRLLPLTSCTYSDTDVFRTAPRCGGYTNTSPQPTVKPVRPNGRARPTGKPKRWAGCQRWITVIIAQRMGIWAMYVFTPLSLSSSGLLASPLLAGTMFHHLQSCRTYTTGLLCPPRLPRQIHPIGIFAARGRYRPIRVRISITTPFSRTAGVA